MGAGRPRKYKTRKSLSDGIERYFKSISRTVEAKDMTGATILNDDGEPIRMVQYVVPPSISGMCLFLGIDRSTWQNYCDGDMHPEFQTATTEARERIVAYLEQQLLTREKGLQGVIFNLQNNYGWRAKQEVELGEKTRKTAQIRELSLTEKMELIAQATRDFAEENRNEGEGAGSETD